MTHKQRKIKAKKRSEHYIQDLMPYLLTPENRPIESRARYDKTKHLTNDKISTTLYFYKREHKAMLQNAENYTHMELVKAGAIKPTTDEATEILAEIYESLGTIDVPILYDFANNKWVLTYYSKSKTMATYKSKSVYDICDKYESVLKPIMGKMLLLKGFSKLEREVTALTKTTSTEIADYELHKRKVSRGLCNE